MDRKRSQDVRDSRPDSKRSRRSHSETPLALEDPDALGDEAVEAEYYLEQSMVGWVIGKGGAATKEVERSYEVLVSLDQSTKDEGYSRLKITGLGSAVQKAAEHINSSLARASAERNGGTPLPGPFLMDRPPGGAALEESFRIEQRFVGWLLGKGGVVVRDIEQASGCKISIDQDTRHLGYSMAQLTGSPEQRSHARQLILESIERAKALSASRTPEPVHEVAERRGGSTEETDFMRVEQHLVGWVLGRSGATLRDVEAQSGARVSFDQSTKDQGFSTARISGTRRQNQTARQMIMEKMGQANTRNEAPGAQAPGGMPDSIVELRIEQWCVDAHLGNAGSMVRDIEGLAGVSLSVDQSTKDHGYSTLRIVGAWRQTIAACQMIDERIVQVEHRDGIDGESEDGIQESNLEQGGDSLMQIEQRCVGWVVGKSGVVLSDIEAQSGTRISLDQSTKDQGFSTAQISGSEQQIATARQLLEEKIAQADQTPRENKGGTSGQAPPWVAPDSFEAEVRVEQRCVGWILGKAGCVLKEIESQSGARISVDQSTKALGYSTARISGRSQATGIAKRLIQEKVAQVGPASKSWS